MHHQQLDTPSFKKAVKNLDEFLWNIANNVICTICHELFSDPVTTTCGHSFCSNCLKKFLFGNNTKNGCPLCRHPIKRRESNNNHVLSVIANICCEFPSAFKEDVRNLSDQKEIIEDLLSTSRICEIYNEKEKEKNQKALSKKKRRGVNLKDKLGESVLNNSEVSQDLKINDDSMDLKSVSQIESKSYIADSVEMEDKLKQMEGVPCKQKVSDWLEDVKGGYESPGCSFLKDDTDSSKQPTENKVSSSMIRVDYDKTKKLQNDDKESDKDPYEFIASQNRTSKKKKSLSRCRKKTIPEFEAIHNFTKDSIKKNLPEAKIEDPVRESSPLFNDTNSIILQKTAKTYSRKSSMSKTITLGVSEEMDEEKEEHCGRARIVSDTDSNASFLDKTDKRPKARRRLIAAGPIIDSDDSSEAVIQHKKPKFDNDSLVSNNNSESGCSAKSKGKRSKKTKKTAEVPSKCSQSPGWSRVSNLKNDFEAADKRTRYHRKSLNISGGELNLSSKSRSVEASPEVENNVTVNNNDVYIDDSSQKSQPLVGFDSQTKTDKEGFKRMVEVMEEELKEVDKSRDEDRKEVEVKTVLPAPNKVVPETVKKITSKASNRKTIPFALLGKIQKKKNSSTLFVKLGRLSANIARSHAAVVKIIFPSATKKAKKPITSAVGCQTDPAEEVVQTDKKKDSADVEIQTIQTQSVKEVQTSQIEQKTVHVQTSDSENFTMSGMFKDFNTPVMTREEKMDVDMDINTELQCELNKTWATQEQKNPQEKGSKGEEEVIDLVSRDSSDISRVMDNINLDLARVRAIRSVKPVSQHRDEESDSDIFIEQTPPKNVSMRKDVAQEESQASFLMISGVPEEKSVLIHDENNQNEMNQFKKPARKEVTKGICIASSGVINRKNIDKFVSKFGVEHLSAPRKDMTHLIVGLHENDEEERVPYCTPKLLYAIANKKWVVTEEWIEKCLEENKFVPEEQYESVDPAGGNGCAVARVSTGLLLGNCEVYLLGEYDRISKQEFSGLIEDCGGKIVRHPGEFSYSAGKIRMILADSSDNIDKEEVKRLVKKTKTLAMSRDVIIVSIQSYKLTNFVPFLLHFPATADPVNWGYPADLLKGVDDESLDDEMCSWT